MGNTIGMKRFKEFMINKNVVNTETEADKLFNQLKISFQYNEFMQSFSTRYPILFANCENDPNNVMEKLLLEGVCKSRNQDELLSNLLIIFDVEKYVDDAQQSAIVNEITHLHSNFIIGLFHEHIIYIFDTNTDLHHDLNVAITAANDLSTFHCKSLLNEQQTNLNSFKYAFKGAEGMYESMRNYVLNLSNPSPPVIYEVSDDDEEDDGKVGDVAKTTTQRDHRNKRKNERYLQDFNLQNTSQIVTNKLQDSTQLYNILNNSRTLFLCTK
jgi:hypothetical protein